MIDIRLSSFWLRYIIIIILLLMHFEKGFNQWILSNWSPIFRSTIKYQNTIFNTTFRKHQPLTYQIWTLAALLILFCHLPNPQPPSFLLIFMSTYLLYTVLIIRVASELATVTAGSTLTEVHDASFIWTRAENLKWAFWQKER